MKNFQVTDVKTGKTYWISRAMAVVAIVVAKDESGELPPKFLISKRGPECPDHVGKWQFTCGYLDWDETIKEGVARELYEETGLNIKEIPGVTLTLAEIRDNPKDDARQNVSFRYVVEVPMSKLWKEIQHGRVNKNTVERGGEKGEVDEILLLSYQDIKAMDLQMAFNHADILEDLNNGTIFKLPR